MIGRVRQFLDVDFLTATSRRSRGQWIAEISVDRSPRFVLLHWGMGALCSWAACIKPVPRLARPGSFQASIFAVQSDSAALGIPNLALHDAAAAIGVLTTSFAGTEAVEPLLEAG